MNLIYNINNHYIETRRLSRIKYLFAGGQAFDIAGKRNPNMA